MTGIIAQEMGEVSFGSLHYRALFVVAAMLFLTTLFFNHLARWITRPARRRARMQAR
jgi:ABC-type phosphate transport system permease subunit